MVTFAAAAANREASWCVLIRIEGIGDSTAQWTFCSQAPTYADSTYKEWLTDWPELLTERVDLLGGIPEAGAFSFKVLDYQDQLTGQMGLDVEAITTLSAIMSKATTTLSMVDGSTVSAGAVLYVGAEALKVTAKPTTNTATVTRAWLGTEANPHSIGDPVLLYTPYLSNRAVKLYLVPRDGDSSSEETLFGTYYLETPSFSPDLNTYEFSAKSQMKYLGRLACRQPATFKLAVTPAFPDFGVVVPTQESQASILPHWSSEVVWILLEDKEVAQCGPGNFIAFNRALLNTQQVDLSDGSQITQIFAADPNEHGSFRYSIGPTLSAGATISTSRSSGFLAVDHPIDIMLGILTSSFVVNDGLELVNYDAGYGNWSALPVGYGIGIPASLIDFQSFCRVKARTPDWHLPNFYFGHKSEPIGELLSREILRPFGLYLYISNGKMYCALPQIPVAGVSVAAAISTTDVLRDSATDLNSLPRMTVKQTADAQVSSVVYKTRGPGGLTVNTVYTVGDGKGTYGQPGYYATDEKSIELELSARADQNGFNRVIERLAETRLFRFSRPSFTVNIEVDISFYALKPSDIVQFTMAEIPDFSTAGRGWSLRACEITERAIRVDTNGGARMMLTMIAYPVVAVGQIAPAAVVSSVSTNTATCQANRYTDPTNTLSLPATDVAAFTIGDNTQLCNLDLSSASGSTQKITGIGTNTITLDGNFGGALASGKILRYADRGPSSDNATPTQAASFVALSDDATLTVGASTQKCWRWGEP